MRHAGNVWGTIPAPLFALNKLTGLAIGNPDPPGWAPRLTGTIPPMINLYRLQSLYLRGGIHPWVNCCS